MTDGSGTPAVQRDSGSPDAEAPEAPADMGSETLREQVEEKYDFEQFSPADMAAMTAEEWEAAFDEDAWITGETLLERVSAELRDQVARRELFAVVERTTVDDEAVVLAYDDVGYAVVFPDGSVEGEGTIVGNVEPVVALCAIEEYTVTEPPADAGLPDPADVTAETGGLGDQLLLVLAGTLIIAGGALLLAPLVVEVNSAGALTTVAGLGFLVIGIFLGILVANARLSGRYRAAEYRDRLRAAGVGTQDRPSFLSGEEPAAVLDGDSTGDDPPR